MGSPPSTTNSSAWSRPATRRRPRSKPRRAGQRELPGAGEATRRTRQLTLPGSPCDASRFLASTHDLWLVWHFLCCSSCRGPFPRQRRPANLGRAPAEEAFRPISFRFAGGTAVLRISNILVPTDFSERSIHAFHLAAALARD